MNTFRSIVYLWERQRRSRPVRTGQWSPVHGTTSFPRRKPLKYASSSNQLWTVCLRKAYVSVPIICILFCRYFSLFPFQTRIIFLPLPLKVRVNVEELRHSTLSGVSEENIYTYCTIQMMKSILSILAVMLLLTACGGKGKSTSAAEQGDTIVLRYARNLTLVEHPGYTVATLRNPWDTLQILNTYILVDKNRSLPEELPKGTIVRTPLSKSIVYSSIHCSLLQQLGALASIGGVCDLKYIRLAEIHDGFRQGSIADMGDSMSPDVERIIDLHPDAILLSPFENGGGYGRIEKLNVPIIECADYMETSALGQAEWMRFYGMLFGKQQQADEQFSKVEQSYNALKAQAAALSAAPTVISELKSGSAWYMPGGKSTVAGLYADAGARYIFAADNHSGGVPLSFETVFDQGEKADFWLIKYNQATDKSYRELAQEYAPYTGFEAFKKKNIYACNTGKVSYYEESPFHPDWLLMDLIKIFHPSLLEGYALRYFTKLAD